MMMMMMMMAGLIGWPRQETHSFEKAVVCYLSIFWFTCIFESFSLQYASDKSSKKPLS